MFPLILAVRNWDYSKGVNIPSGSRRGAKASKHRGDDEVVNLKMGFWACVEYGQDRGTDKEGFVDSSQGAGPYRNFRS